MRSPEESSSQKPVGRRANEFRSSEYIRVETITVGGKPDPKGGVVCPASELDSTPASESHAISDFRIAEILAALVRLRRDGAFDEGSEVVALVAGLRDVMREFEMVG